VQCTGCSEELADNMPVAKLTTAGFKIRALARIIDMAYNVFIAFITGAFGTVVLVFLSRMGWLAPGGSDQLSPAL